MHSFIKRMFIPLVIALALLALYLYLFHGSPSRPRDLREAVPISRFSLSNGLSVVVMPSDRVAAVAHLLVVKAGAADDPYGKTGLAHYLEHLMFSGSKNYPEGAYDETIQRMGGEQNAYTTRDYTLYHAVVAREHLPSVMAMEADRLQFLLFDPPKVARELNVITEERNLRIDTNPAAQLMEQLTALTFLNHPYHHPTIGWAEDMATLNRDDAQGYFNSYYRASNMVLILAGDITQADAKRYAQQYYGSLPAGAPPARVWAKEPPMRVSRHATMRHAMVREPLLVRQYVAPSFGDGNSADAIPLSLFAQYLGGSDSSILYQRLVREQKLASLVSVDYNVFAIGPELFEISATPAPGVTLEQLEKALDVQLAEVLALPTPAAAFARAKTQLKAESIYAQDGLFPLANLIASLYARGKDEQVFYNWSATIEAATPEQAHVAASAVLIPARQVTGYLLPEEPHAP